MDRLFPGALYITGAVFLAADLATLWWVLARRQRGVARPSGRGAEAAWTVIPALLVLALALTTHRAHAADRTPVSRAAPHLSAEPALHTTTSGGTTR
jgi:heme/copper-type cytochrome/quinol oxidase subunit 2